MWLFVMFDLPTDTKADRKRYSNFRKALVSHGFSMLQFSIYARYYGSEESSDAQRNKIRAIMPSKGQVRLISITDRQFGKMEVFQGKTRSKPENPPQQMTFF
ncbi:MAG: CRISPR-associated endonuclease Cas2 [Chloroflexi bacterium]|nr:CRISPR-associated endonuclease Cas2 [Chloroflexota bacterium]